MIEVKEELVVKGLSKNEYKWLNGEMNYVIDVLREIYVEYELVKEIKSFWNNVIVKIKVDCKWLSKLKVVVIDCENGIDNDNNW